MEFKQIRNTIRYLKETGRNLSQEYGSLIPVIELDGLEEGGETPIFRVVGACLDKHGRRAPVNLSSGGMADFMSGITKQQNAGFWRSKTYYQAYTEIPLQGKYPIGEKTRSVEEATQVAYGIARRFAGVVSRGTGFELRECVSDEYSKQRGSR